MKGKLFFLLAVLLAGAACRQDGSPSVAEPPAGDGVPTVAVTRWTDLSELFMEYPMMVAGRSGRSAIHVTDLRDFRPLAAGEAVIVLRPSGGGASLEFRGGPSRPGIFGVDMQVDHAGPYQMTLRIEAPGLEDVHDLGEVTVHEPGALPAAEEEAGENISFLQEQQWTLEFGTEPARTRALRASLTVPAEIQPRGGGEAVVTAPVSGQLDPSVGARAPGARVEAGAMLARIIPRSEDLRDAATLRAGLVAAEQRYELAMMDRERAARLVEARAAPGRRLADSEAALTTAKAHLEAERARLSRFESLGRGGSASGVDLLTIGAPFTGVIIEVSFAPGTSVEEGDTLLRLVDVDRVDVVGSIPESRSAALRSVAEAELLVDGSDIVPLGRPVTIGSHVDPATRTIEARFLLDNRRLRLAIGQAMRLRLLLDRSQDVTAVPETALVDDGGRPVVFVQMGGESFERRPVKAGTREGGYVHVIEGIEPGERVVSRGAYLIRLAAMSSQIPSHGHVH